MIQKRTMIFVSDHAFISKWWWIGAIRKTRLPEALERDHLDDHGQRLDHEHAADRASSSSSVFVKTAKRGDRAAEGQRARVAHEDVGREAVVPEEPDAGPEQRGRQDGEVERLVAELEPRRSPTGTRAHGVAIVVRHAVTLRWPTW